MAKLNKKYKTLIEGEQVERPQGNGGSLTNKQGYLFHVTNTNAIISLNNVKLVTEDPEKVLLSVCADGWQGAKSELK